jgi:hypothetical protein
LITNLQPLREPLRHSDVAHPTLIPRMYLWDHIGFNKNSRRSTECGNGSDRAVALLR